LSESPANVRLRKRGRWLLPLGALAALGGIGAWWWPAPAVEEPAAATWVDESTCRSCHAAQHEAWQGSHHHLAMQRATGEAVLGDFADRALRTDVEAIRFLRGADSYRIESPGPDGDPLDRPVAFTLGVEPLQQYLLAMDDGRLQVHGAAWDVPGARWFHLYDGQGVDHRHRLHWTKAQQNADFMCIECHTTGFRRGYDAAADRHESRWHALGVGCQSCHGPASAHLRWAREGGGTAKGFAQPPGQVEVCARCHSRRTPLGNGWEHGADLLDDFLPMLLTADLYEVDGKILDEVFEYGSFAQSRMHEAGVVCTDCHDPHRAALQAPGNGVCVRCHNPSARANRAGIDGSRLQPKRYDDPSHHRHAAGTPGSACVDCHMPGRLYMGNDLRRDHAFTSPHPRQATELGHSDACLGCHEGKREEVLEAFDRWYPDAAPRDGGFARALHAARNGKPGAAEGLLRQLARDDLPAIRRATLIGELAAWPSAAAQRAVVEALGHPSPLVRRSAIEAAAALLPAPAQLQLFPPLQDDPVRAVRLAAAWQLAQLPEAVAARTTEYEAVQETMLDRAESHFNLAGIYAATGRGDRVEPALRRALQLDPAYFPALVLLSQWREQAAGDVEGARRLLEEALALHPDEGSLWHALGLMQVRRGEKTRALESLRRAHEAAPADAAYGYVYAVALHDAGEREAALRLLRDLLLRHPADRTVRQALLGLLRGTGAHGEAEALLDELALQNPGDPLLRGRNPTHSTQR